MRVIDVVVPVLDEVDHIDRVLDEIKAMARPHFQIKTFVIEGGSRDGTRDRLALRDDIVIVENPGGRKPVGLNRVIRQSTADVIVRIDAHASYPDDYVQRLLEVLETSGADCVGGVRSDAVAATRVGRAIAHVNGSVLGNGNAAYRTGVAGVTEADSVFPGFWPRSVFDRVGFFDERLDRGQDREMSARIRAAGGTILLTPEVEIVYFGRTGLLENLAWISVGGEWAIRAAGVGGPRVLRLRNLVPALFVLYLLMLVLLGRRHPVTRWPLVGYASLLTREAVGVLRSDDGAQALLVATMYPLTHVAYGVGSLLGLLRLRRAFA